MDPVAERIDAHLAQTDPWDAWHIAPPQDRIRAVAGQLLLISQELTAYSGDCAAAYRLLTLNTELQTIAEEV